MSSYLSSLTEYHVKKISKNLLKSLPGLSDGFEQRRAEKSYMNYTKLIMKSVCGKLSKLANTSIASKYKNKKTNAFLC